MMEILALRACFDCALVYYYQMNQNYDVGITVHEHAERSIHIKIIKQDWHLQPLFQLASPIPACKKTSHCKLAFDAINLVYLCKLSKSSCLERYYEDGLAVSSVLG